MTDDAVQQAQHDGKPPAERKPPRVGVVLLVALGLVALGVALHLLANEWFLAWGCLVASGVWIGFCTRGLGSSRTAAAIRFGVGLLYFCPIMGFVWKILLSRPQRLELLRTWSDATCVYALYALALVVVLATGFLARHLLRRRVQAPPRIGRGLPPALLALGVFYLLAWGPLVCTLRTLELDKSRVMSRPIYYATWPHQWLARNIESYRAWSRFWGDMAMR